MTQAQDIEHEETTAALDVESILAIHRNPDGHIGFVRKPDPEAPDRLDKNGRPYTFENLFSIRADDLRSMFPVMAEWLTHDSYFTVNAFYRAAPYNNKQTGLPGVWRGTDPTQKPGKKNALCHLTACYADIDSGRPESDEPGAELSWRQAQHQAEALADAGVIPQPSIMARSGRGVYLFWLLRDDKEPTELPHAWPEKVELYKACNRALNERLRAHNLPADKAAIDAARVLRVPGSIHRKALRRVRYVIQLDDGGKGFTYSLPELSEALDLPMIDGDLPDQTRRLARPAQYRKVKNPGAAPLRSLGAQALNALRAQDLLTIQAHRGGFLKRGEQYQDGTISPGRRFMLNLYANFLSGSKLDQGEAIDSVRDMAANMRPPWPDDPSDPTFEALVDSEYSTEKRRRWRNKKLLPLLGVSADMARELDLKTLIPPEVKEERDQARPLQADIIQARRDWLRHYITAHPTPGDGGRWTASKVRDALTPFSPHPWNNRMTANQDLNAIGYRMHRSRGGRPRKQAKQ